MLQALGLKFMMNRAFWLDLEEKLSVKFSELTRDGWDLRIEESEFLIASDVQNPVVGPNGDSHVFGPQKGATPEMVEKIGSEFDTFGRPCRKRRRSSLTWYFLPGAGAAGGIGGAFQAFFPAEMKRGIDIVIEFTKLVEKLKGADLVFTGEGQIDFQTASGKTPMGVAQAAQKQGVPVIVIAGSIGRGIDSLYQYGITSIHSIVNAPMLLEDAMTRAEELLEERAEQIIRTFSLALNQESYEIRHYHPRPINLTFSSCCGSGGNLR